MCRAFHGGSNELRFYEAPKLVWSSPVDRLSPSAFQSLSDTPFRRTITTLSK